MALGHGDGHRLCAGVAGSILGLDRDGVNSTVAGATALGAEVEREGAGDFDIARGVAVAKAVVRLVARGADNLQ